MSNSPWRLVRNLAAVAVVSVAAVTPGVAVAAGEETPPADLEAAMEQMRQWQQQFEGSLDRKTGVVELPGGMASLDLGQEYYYLSPADARRVLTEAWGNPAAGETLGMIFPAEYSPLDEECWGVTIDYTEDGYVSDEDANSIDYDQLLKDMQAGTVEENKQREQAGFEPIRLVGWASPPRYDAAEHKLHWAKELQFGESETNTLNYNIRALGRKGVLELNFVADMSQLPEIERRRGDVMSAVSFNPGYRYSEFDPSIDKIAAYGIGGLVAGKVLVKTGLLLKLALIFKKFWIVLLLAGGAVAKKLFGGKSDSPAPGTT